VLYNLRFFPVDCVNPEPKCGRKKCLFNIFIFETSAVIGVKSFNTIICKYAFKNSLATGDSQVPYRLSSEVDFKNTPRDKVGCLGGSEQC
jgi:hypothetical protein